jgi:hypothetical protein
MYLFEPLCPLQFKFSLNLAGTMGDCVAVTPAHATYLLGLCGKTVTFNTSCCFDDVDSIILGIPLTIYDDANHSVYRLVVPSIPAVNYNGLVTVLDQSNNIVPGLDIQIADGYAYITMPFTSFSMDDGLITITFGVFALPYVKSFMFCRRNIHCKPIIWAFGSDYTSTCDDVLAFF